MEREFVCEFLLNIYKDLELSCEHIDKSILNYAVHSKNANINIIFNKMVELTQEKIACCNIKVLIEEACAELGSDTELQYRYLLGYKYEDIKKIFGISKRTVYRRIEEQKKDLFFIIKQKQNNIQLFNLIASSQMIMRKFNEFIRQTSKKEQSNDI